MAGLRSLHGAELIDLDTSPQDRKVHRRRRVLRIGVPIVSVALLIGAVLGISLYSYESNRRGASRLSDDLLVSLERRIATEVTTYLAPALKMTQFARQTLGASTFESGGAERAEQFGRNLLRTYGQIASFYVADGRGQFLMMLRDEHGDIETKLIAVAPDGARQVRLYRRNALGQIVNERAPQDDFDPRTRPWYRGAAAVRDQFWTDVYVFHTSRAPGITTSLPLLGEDGGVAAIYGIDITLSALSKFLSEIEIGSTGRAMIIDADGRLVAYPEPERILREEEGKLVQRRLDELGELALTRAFNRLRIEGPGHGTVDIEGERVIFASAALPIAANKEWSVLIVVPEREIIGFLAANNRTSLLLSLSIVGVAILMAALLIRQGISADRNARLVRDRQLAAEKQANAFAALAESTAAFDPDDERGRPALSELLADVTGARRVSIWQLTHGGRSLLCQDCFDRESRIHTSGIELHRAELPRVWSMLQAGDEIDVADAATDPRTGALYNAYLQPLGVRALMALPIRRGGEAVGSVWLEDPPAEAHRPAGLESFARTVANVEAARMGDPARAAAASQAAPSGNARARAAAPLDKEPADRVVPSTPAARTEAAIDPRRQEILRVRQRIETAASGDPNVFSAVTVLTVLLADALATGQRVSRDADADFVDAIVRVLEDAAAPNAVPYLKVLGDRIVAAAGFSGDPSEAAGTVAQAALAVRGSDDPRARRLRMGMDTGLALGGAVGRDGACFNLWGPAVRRSADMAECAPHGGIQATAFSYEEIASEFLFRPRGTFYLHAEGETATYLLAGQI